MKKRRRKLPVIQLPEMRCDVGCGDCCGPAPLSRYEADIVRAYVRKHGIVPVNQGVKCPFYQRGVCAIYEARPAVCRAFGHSWMMECSRGYNVNVADERRLAEWVLAHGSAATTLHALAGIQLDTDALAAKAEQLVLDRKWHERAARMRGA